MYATIFDQDRGQKTSLTKLLLKRSVLKQSLPNFQHKFHLLRPVAAIKIHADYAGTADYTRISEWAQLDLQSIQHRD